MLEELLRIDKLPTLSELRFILNVLRDASYPMLWVDLFECSKDRSLNLRLSFDNGIKLLTSLSLIRVTKDNIINCTLTPQQESQLGAEYTFCAMVTKLLILNLDEAGMLPILFNQETVKFDIVDEKFALNVNLFPLQFPMMKIYLLAMDIGVPDRNMRGRILIREIYKSLFKDLVFKKVLKDSYSVDIVVGESAEPEPSIQYKHMPNGVRVFISYTRVDEEFKEKLRKHFTGLINQNLVRLWHDGLIAPGEEWDEAIKKNLDEADYVFFLISADFMASDYINRVEIKRAIQRHDEGKTTIIPIIVRDCDHASLPILKFQALPSNAKAIVNWRPHDKAYLDIVKKFKAIIKPSPGAQ